MRRRARLLPAALLVLAAAGCSTLLWETGLPWSRAEFTVETITRRGPFLEVQVAGGGIERRYFTRATEECRDLLRSEAVVTLKTTERFQSGDLECAVAGIGDLEKLRGSRSRGGYGTSPIQRGNDRIEFVYEDEQYRYARGGFSIAALFGWAPGTDQVVALLPKTPECAAVTEGPVSVLYRDAGSPALGIPAGDELCPIHGLIAVERGDF